eukprot:11265781-Prorocentrum_lima.AAC.1
MAVEYGLDIGEHGNGAMLAATKTARLAHALVVARVIVARAGDSLAGAGCVRGGGCKGVGFVELLAGCAIGAVVL